jgi:hypothetical protein
MSRNRFLTVRDVFEAFPQAASDLEIEPSEDSPLDVIGELAASDGPERAVTLCAYVLPRREAVWWGCQCLRKVFPSVGAEEKMMLEAAEAWVREPEEERRRKALTRGNQGDGRSPAAWVALAAGWSGGNVSSAEAGAVPAPPDLTARAIRVAVLSSLARVGARERAATLTACVEMGLNLLRGPARSRR